MTLKRWLPTFLAFPLGGYLAYATVGSVTDPATAAVGGLLAGAVIGAGQWLALRDLGIDRRWAVVTAAAMTAGSAARGRRHRGGHRDRRPRGHGPRDGRRRRGRAVGAPGLRPAGLGRRHRVGLGARLVHLLRRARAAGRRGLRRLRLERRDRRDGAHRPHDPAARYGGRDLCAGAAGATGASSGVAGAGLVSSGPGV